MQGYVENLVPLLEKKNCQQKPKNENLKIETCNLNLFMPRGKDETMLK